MALLNTSTQLSLHIFVTITLVVAVLTNDSLLFVNFNHPYISPKNNSIIVWYLMVVHCGMPCLTTFVLRLLLLHSGRGSNHTFLTWPSLLNPSSPWCRRWCRPLLCPQTYKIAKHLCLMRLRVCNCGNKHCKVTDGMEWNKMAMT